MDRRRFLAALSAGASGALAGCPGIDAGERPTDAGGTGASTHDGDGTATPARTATPASLARRGSPADICQRDLPDDPIVPGIIDPAFADDWADVEVAARYAEGADGAVGADHTVVGLTDGDGTARAYPLAVLFHHEVVNDALAGPVAVTYCPLCRSALVFDRLVGGEAATFLVTGLLWTPPSAPAGNATAGDGPFGADREGGERRPVERDDNLVMRDGATGSYWSQLLARAICGPAAGETLALRPATLTTWAEWRGEHPDTAVLLPPPHSAVQRPIG